MSVCVRVCVSFRFPGYLHLCYANIEIYAQGFMPDYARFYRFCRSIVASLLPNVRCHSMVAKHLGQNMFERDFGDVCSGGGVGPKKVDKGAYMFLLGLPIPNMNRCFDIRMVSGMFRLHNVEWGLGTSLGRPPSLCPTNLSMSLFKFFFHSLSSFLLFAIATSDVNKDLKSRWMYVFFAFCCCCEQCTW